MRIDVRGVIIPNDDKWIYDYFEMESTSPKDISGAISQAMGQPIDIYINSGGGDIFAGSDIYTSLRDYKGSVMQHIIWAASAASVIAMAGKSDISPTGMLMVHNVSSMAAGDYHVMDKTSDILQQANKMLAAAYMAKSGMSEKDTLAMMDKETWLTAKQAVDMKLADGVMFDTGQQLVASYGSGILPKSVVEKIRNTVKNPLNPKQDEADFLSETKARFRLLNLGGK